MANPIYIYSTLAASQDYGTTVGMVRIEGGANVTSKHMFTPRGVCTEVTDVELEALRAHDVFAAHLKNGFLHIDVKEVKADKVAEDMNADDKGAQATKETLSKKASGATAKVK